MPLPGDPVRSTAQSETLEQAEIGSGDFSPNEEMAPRARVPAYGFASNGGMQKKGNW